MASAVQDVEFREARADLVRAALRVVDHFGAFPKSFPAEELLHRYPELYVVLRDLERAKARWRMYALPEEMVRP